MFGLFGRKKKEKEVSVQEEAPKKETGTESAEVRDFAADFEPDVLDVLVLTGPNGFWGEKDEDGTMFTLSVELTAWLEEDVPGVHQGDFQLVTKGDEMLKEFLRSHVPGDFILKVKARVEKNGGNRLLMVNLPEPGFDAELKAIRDEQCKPVTFWIDGLGTFTLARSVGWFSCETEWLGETVQITIDQDEERDGSVETAKVLMENPEKWDRAVRDLAAEQLPAEIWESGEEDGEEPAEEAAQDRLGLESIQVKADGGFVFWLNDGNPFSGRSVRVSGTLETGPETAAVED